tara:strand:+ start:1157 stop:1351 length:195 start_codon:yes stop_codon:yes gene_type:complete
MKTIHCDSETTYRNKKTNVLYKSKEDAQHDVENPNTDTKQEDIAVDTKIIVPPEALSLLSDTQE